MASFHWIWCGEGSWSLKDIKLLNFMKIDEQEKEANPLISQQMEICLMSSTLLSPCSCVQWWGGGETCPLIPRVTTCVLLIANQSASTALVFAGQSLTSIVPFAFMVGRLLSSTLPLRQPVCNAAVLMGRGLIGCCGWWAPPAPPPAGSWWGTPKWGLTFRWWPGGMGGRSWFLKNGLLPES